MAKTYLSTFVVISALCMSGCDQPPQSQGTERVSGNEVADKLEDAADQSGPAAQSVLTEAADKARQYPSMAPVDQPGSYAQDAMQDAGNAEASAADQDAASSPTN